MRDNPYIGPRPFQIGERAQFFGRDRESRELSALASFEQLVLLYGRSGVGRTSLINTSLIPALAKEGFRVLPIGRVGGSLPPAIDPAGVSNIFICSLLLSLASETGTLPSDLARMTLSEFLSLYFDSQDPVLETQQDRYNPEQHFSLLLIHQLEELFTTHHGHWQERHDFFAQLGQALKDYPALSVILSLREDYLAELDPYLPLLPGKLRARYRLEPLGPEAAVEAILRPASYAGVPFESGVAERLVDDLRRVKGQEGDILLPYVEPAQLQVVCYQLWENLPEQADGLIQWEAVGQSFNIDWALTDLYESALKLAQGGPPGSGGNVSERQLRTWFGEKLITPLGTRGLVLRGPADTAGLPNEVVVMLENHHIIRADAISGTRWYELCNDTMVDPILKSNRAWEREQENKYLWRPIARQWQTTRSDTLLYRGKELQEARLWLTTADPGEVEPYEHEFIQASQQAQQARVRQQRVRTRVSILGVTIILVMAYLVLWALGSRQNELEFDPNNAKTWNELCWDGSLNGYAAELLFACGRAVELEPDYGDHRDGRGLARALTGDYAGAIEDFSFAVEYWQEQSACERNNVNRCDQRQEWIKALEARRNPFTPEVLGALRDE